MNFRAVAYLSVLTLLLLLFPHLAGALSLEELAEIFCDYYDGVSCTFEEHHAVYKFGPHHAMQGGNGKIRSQSAYCLIRDGDGQAAKASSGEEGEWNEFGSQSRFHITYAGKDETGLYRAEGQRILDLVLLGHVLEGAEVQDLLTGFPAEKEKGKKGSCKKWTQIGGKKICSQFNSSPSFRTGYYMTLNTHFYEWEIDVDEVVGDLSALFGGPPVPDGFEMALGQDVPFEYYGTTQLDGTDLILDDGIIPPMAYPGNLWEWGMSPDEETAGSYLTIEFPVVSARFASLDLFFDIGLNGYYALEEGPLAIDPDAGLMDDPPPADEMTTSTHLEGGANIAFTLEACLDFGFFGTWCGDFDIVDAEETEKRNPLNLVAYTPRGKPLHAVWADGEEAGDARETNNQINACLNAEPIVQEPEEPATPADWVAFLTAVAETAEEHYEPCYVTEPSNSVSYTEPDFKLCDDSGGVFEAVSGLYQR